MGADGATHAGSFDIAYLGCLPNMVLMAAADEVELMHMVATSAAIDDRPSAFRYPRGEGFGLEFLQLASGHGFVVVGCQVDDPVDDWDNMSDSGLSMGAWVRNAFKEKYYVGGLAQGASLGLNAANVGRPRMYGLEISAKF